MNNFMLCRRPVLRAAANAGEWESTLRDPRDKKLAELLVNYSCKLQPGESCLIHATDTPAEFVEELIAAVKCSGNMNIPDGEVYSCPVKDSVEGNITYNTPSSYHGFTFTDVHLEFEKGKIVKAEFNDNERINKIFDTDRGARYVGEFALG